MLGLFRSQILGIDLKVGRFGFKMIGVLSKIGGILNHSQRGHGLGDSGEHDEGYDQRGS